jgi:membrane protease YdiL (CAAX protease family)
MMKSFSAHYEPRRIWVVRDLGQLFRRIHPGVNAEIPRFSYTVFISIQERFIRLFSFLASHSIRMRVSMSASIPLQPVRDESVRNQTPAGTAKLNTILTILASRLILFAFSQAIIAGILALSGQGGAWQAATAWWPVTVVLTNAIVLFALVHLYRREGSHWLAPLRFERATVGRDLLLLLASGVVMGPISMLPASLLGGWLYGGVEHAYALFFLPLPVWAAVLSLVLFPVTVALAELPAYFGYVLPRLQSHLGSRWLAWLVCSLVLAAQHITMPLVFDGRFMLWRFLMFLPFALMVGWLLSWRPRLLPYLVIFHGLLDLGTVWFVFAASMGIG